MLIYKDELMEMAVSHGFERTKELILDFLLKNKEYKKIIWDQHWLTVVTDSCPLSIEDISPEKRANLIQLEEALFEAEHDDCDCKTLDEFMNQHPCCKHFRPNAFYNVDGDQLEVTWSDQSAYGKELNGRHGYATMCLMKAQKLMGDMPVGVTVYNLKKVLKEAGFKIVPI